MVSSLLSAFICILLYHGSFLLCPNKNKMKMMHRFPYQASEVYNILICHIGNGKLFCQNPIKVFRTHGVCDIRFSFFSSLDSRYRGRSNLVNNTLSTLHLPAYSEIASVLHETFENIGEPPSLPELSSLKSEYDVS